MTVICLKEPLIATSFFVSTRQLVIREDVCTCQCPLRCPARRPFDKSFMVGLFGGCLGLAIQSRIRHASCVYILTVLSSRGNSDAALNHHQAFSGDSYRIFSGRCMCRRHCSQEGLQYIYQRALYSGDILLNAYACKLLEASGVGGHQFCALSIEYVTVPSAGQFRASCFSWNV